MLESEKTDQRRLRICFVGTPWLAVGPDRGGIEKVLLELSRIISRDHEVHVVCPTPRDEAPSTGEPKIVFHYAPVTEVRRYPIRDKLDFTLEGILLSVRFLFATIVMAAFCMSLFRRHAFDVTYVSNKFVAAPILLLTRNRSRGVFIYAEHNIWPWLHPRPDQWSARLRYGANKYLGRFVCRRSDRIHVNSESLRVAMAGSGIDERRMVPIPNGTEVPPEGVVPAPLAGSMRVGFVGRLAEEKGIEMLVGATRLLNARQPRIRFEIFGDGPLRPMLLAAGLQNCTLWGERPREEVLEALRSINIVLFLSPVENIPSVALMEALALGKAVVATNVGDTPHFLRDGHDALLCEPDPGAVAEAVVSLCENPSLYDKVTEGARELAASNTWEEVARKHLALFRSARTPVAS